MDFDGLFKALENYDISSNNEALLREIDEIYDTAKNEGLSKKDVLRIINVLGSYELDINNVKSLIQLLIPNFVLSNKTIEKLIEWIHREHQLNTDLIEAILVWIANLLQFDLLHESIDDWFMFFEGLLPYFPKPISHILHIITKPEDVVSRSIQRVEKLLLLHENPPYLCALLRRYKELNPQFSQVKVPSYKTQDVFIYDDKSYKNLLKGLKNMQNRDNDTTKSIVVPNKKVKLNDNSGCLPKPHYLQDDSSPEGNYFHEITTPSKLGASFRSLVLPTQSLTLLQNEIGIYILMFSPKSLQKVFLNNLYATLYKVFRTEPEDVSKSSKEKLLNAVVSLQIQFQQGFIAVSKFLRDYLRTWDGFSFKNQIYMLLRWFVFRSVDELRDHMLKPLYTLFVVGDEDVACEILSLLTHLITNLFFMIRKENRGLKNLYEEDIICTREKLTPILGSLSKFYSHLCKLSLYHYPCSNKILTTALDFYHKIDQLEDDKTEIRTIISSSVLYHSFLSFNGQILDRACALLPKYREKIIPGENQPNLMNARYNRLMGYASDLYEFLYTSQAFKNRLKGRMLYSLPIEHTRVWENYANLNNGLDLRRHIMFLPQRVRESLENKSQRSEFRSNMEVLDVIREDFPHIVQFIEIVLNNVSQSEIDEDAI